MQLSREAIEEFKAIYQDEYGIALSDAETREIRQRLLRLFQVLACPLPAHVQGAPHSHAIPVDADPDPDMLKKNILQDS